MALLLAQATDAEEASLRDAGGGLLREKCAIDPASDDLQLRPLIGRTPPEPIGCAVNELTTQTNAARVTFSAKPQIFRPVKLIRAVNGEAVRDARSKCETAWRLPRHWSQNARECARRPARPPSLRAPALRPK